MRGDIRVDYERRGSRYKDTSHFSSRKIGLTDGGNWRGGYRSQTIHSSSNNLDYHGRLLRIPGSSRRVDDSLHENERGDSRGDGERRIIWSQ